MNEVSFMKPLLALGILVCGLTMFVSCAEEAIAPNSELSDGLTVDDSGDLTLDDSDGSNDNADGDRGTDNDDIIDIDTNTDGGNDNADGERGYDNDDVIDADLSTGGDGNDNADGERGTSNDDVVDLDVYL